MLTFFAFLLTKISVIAHFLLSRVIAWTGMAYFFRKSKKTGKRRYKWIAILIYSVSWLAVLVGYSALLVAIWKKIGSRI